MCSMIYSLVVCKDWNVVQWYSLYLTSMDKAMSSLPSIEKNIVS